MELPSTLIFIASIRDHRKRWLAEPRAALHRITLDTQNAVESPLDLSHQGFTAEVDDAKVTNFRINAKVTFDLER
jgi:hypothetical protein